MKIFASALILLFFSFSAFAGKAKVDSLEKVLKGLPDGLKIDKNGNVFATGPGGIWIFNKDAKLLGRIKLDEATSNCALSPDEKTLYITNDMYVVRVKLRE